MTAAAVAKTLKVAIIGSGPSAFYSAARLLSSATTSTSNVEVHMYERLPTPHGLVRYGVAPDHPEVKNVEHKFAQVASDPRFHFYGNVNVVETTSIASTGMYDYPLATHVPIGDVLPHYTHVLLSYGCSLARTLGVPGSGMGELRHVHSALDVVNWYNGHPAAHDAAFLAREPWRKVALADAHVRHATIVGAGNVALDVARILLRARTTLHDLFTADSSLKARAALRQTDIPEPVLAALSQCSVDTVEIVARRGPAQVAFTNKELREMMELQDVTFQAPLAEHMALAREQVAALEAMAKTSPEAASEARVRKRLLGIVDKGSVTKNGRVRWAMDFFKAPHALLARDDANGGGASADVGAVRWSHMAFDPVPSLDDRQQPWSGGAPRPQSPKNQLMLRHTGEQVDSKTDMVIASVGYKAAPLAGSDNGSAVPWDARAGVVPNRGGQVVNKEGKQIPGMYVSGWLARGPVGVIASTRIDANSVVEQMLLDTASTSSASSSQPPALGAPEALRTSTRKTVSWADWLRLDAEEVRRGQALGKLREKVLCAYEGRGGAGRGVGWHAVC